MQINMRVYVQCVCIYYFFVIILQTLYLFVVLYAPSLALEAGKILVYNSLRYFLFQKVSFFLSFQN